MRMVPSSSNSIMARTLRMAMISLSYKAMRVCCSLMSVAKLTILWTAPCAFRIGW